MKERNKTLTAVAVYAASLYLLWTLVETVLSPRMEITIDHFTVELIKEIGIKTVIWTVPAIMLARRFDGEMFIKKKPLSEKLKEVNFIPPIILLVLLTAYVTCVCYLSNGKIAISKSFSLWHIPLCAFIGVSEEAVFRGLFLNCTLKEGRKNIIALLLNAVMFLAVHFPIWYIKGELVHNFTSGAFLQLMGLSIIFGVVYMKSKTLAAAAAVHGYWDLLCFMFL